jgi:arylsulfatase A-like enzyme
MHRALDIGREPARVRERYGWTLFGQACLAARRLVEAGCRFVTVFWDGYGQFASCAWDTHANHFPRLREYLLPGLDQAYPALIEDLEARGLLGDTLVLWLSEHGRTPRLDSRPAGAGRHHWSRAYSALLAGGGAARGRVVGSTDRLGGEVRETPVSPKDVLATALHLLGIDPATAVPDAQGRPQPVAGDGQVRPELLG